MENKDAPKYKDFDSSSDTSSVGSDESLEQASGPNFAEFARQLTYEKGEENTYYSPFDQEKKEVKEGTYSFPTTFTEKKDPPKSTDVTTLFLIDSLNRDRVAFPQPTNLTLKLPRTYKNVKSISLTQVKLLCSFYYFSDSTAKSNIYLPIREKAREKISTFYNQTLTKVLTIRQGTYGINDLLNEIQTQMNFTPLFYDFPGGFTDFIKIFTVSGDFGINFNQPGDTYYDSLNNKYIQNPSFATIVSYYWGSRYAGLPSYTMDQFKVAYYYPVLYEVFLDEIDTIAYPSVYSTKVPDNLLAKDESVYSHLIFNMSGINDKVALYLINQNIALLDKYRDNHTFRTNLVNRYQLAYDTNSLQVNITTTALNTSLVNLINNTSSAALTSILTNLGLTPQTYATLQNNVNKATVVYTGMFQYLQQQLTALVGISFATYAASYFNNIDNIIYFQNGLNAVGVRKGYTLEYLTSGEIPLVSTITNLTNSPVYWPRMIAANGYKSNLSSINSANSIIPYNIPGKNFQFGNTVINSTDHFFNTNKASRSVDAVVNIYPGQYTIFKFRSSARQTLQVETLPLPYYYRYADYNKTGQYKGILDLNRNNVPQKYFDISYNFVYNDSNKSMDLDSSKYKPYILLSVFGKDFNTSFIEGSTLTANSQTNYVEFEFTAPYPPGVTTGLCATNTSISFVSMTALTGNLSTLFPDSFTAFVYHDRAAFMADLNFPRKENPLHFIKVASTNSTKSDITINFSTFSGHKYYTIFRSDNLACSNTLYKPLVCTSNLSTIIKTDYLDFDPLADPTSNLNKYPFVTNYNPDFTRLPTNSNLTGFDPTNSSFNMVLPIKELPIGYDISGVSNDLTDYIGYVSGEKGFDPTTKFRVDPLSFYTFQYLSPFDTLSTTYFNSSSSNSILEPITNNTYNHKGATMSEVKIVHWYDGFSIPKQLDDPFTSFNTINISNTSSMSEYIKSYPVNSDNEIILGRGINAIGFLPNDGLFEVSSFSFKSCIYPISDTQPTAEDPNLQIAYVGVFSGLSLVNNIISLSSALTVLKFQDSVSYGPNTLYKTPGFGSEFGTWYTYSKDSDFVPITTLKVSGYTPNSNELLSYNSMYYMVPFNSKGANLTYSALSGSLLAYPKAYTVSLSNLFYGQTTQNTPGANPQGEYIIPLRNNAVDAAYGPQSIYSPTQSQYAGSIPITTTSLGYKEYSYLANDINTPFSFSTFITTNTNSITAFVSEYSDNMYIVNSHSIACSNSLMSYPSAAYASSLSTVIKLNGGKTDCIQYLSTPHAVLQNYGISGTILTFSTFTFEKQDGGNSDITTRSIELNRNMSSIKLWLWGGGGGALPNTDNIYGGAGAHANVNLDVNTLLNQGLSTLYVVVGKGGNRDNVDIIETVGSLQLYEERRYGGGGTSLLGKFDNKNSIALQGGGFSGIFTGSNINTSNALLIVGGGGAAGGTQLGGPGGFGITEIPLNITDYSFNTATFNGTFYSPIDIINVRDVFNNSIINMGSVQNTIDRNLNTIWDVVYPSKMNPNNYIPTANTYGLTLQYSRIPTQIQKIRYYGPPIENKVNLPTGFILYNDQNKSQILYSNTGIKQTDFQIINNGSFQQQIYEFKLTRQVIPQTISKMAWIAVGLNTTPDTSIQYSLDRLTWVPTQNSTLSNITSIQYVAIFSRWFASSDTILQSSDGITWSPCQVTGFTGTIFNTIAFGLNKLIAGGNDGSLFISTDGSNWTFTGTKFTNAVTRIRFINGAFWAIGGSVKRSVDGIVWTNIDGLLTINDIAYGVGRYVIAQSISEPFNSGILYSEDGNTFTWTSPSQLNINKFTGISIVYANNIFAAVGKTTDNSSFIKYSVDGINWSSSRFSTNSDIERSDIQYVGNIFVSIGTSKRGTGLAGNQVSIITSTDAINWSYSLSGGFDPDLQSVQGNSVAYGPITIIPNLSTLYMEIQSESNKPYIYEIRSYDTSSTIPGNTLSLIDNNLDTIFYPPEQFTVDVLEYPFVFTLSPAVVDLNKLTIYAPSTYSSLFTGIRVTLENKSVVYTDLNITSFKQDTGTSNNYYEILFVPQLKDISVLNLTFVKNTPGSIKISGIKASYDPNIIVEEKYIASALDLDNRPSSNGISNIYDSDITRYWAPDRFIPGDFLRFNVTFRSAANRINRIQVYSGTFPPVQRNIITYIGVYTDSTKSLQLYSSSNLIFREYNGLSMVDLDILPILGYTSVYIEIGKITQGVPLINEIKFYNIGRIDDTANGYNSGNTITMTRDIISETTRSLINPYGGGGGTNSIGGYAGPYAYNGDTFIGGSPAILKNQNTISRTIDIEGGAGGGGGGYYGGGGGGIVDTDGLIGAGGGGGSGFIFRGVPIFSNYNYSVAVPGVNTSITNYISPAFDEQDMLINNNIIEKQLAPYGQGGNPLIDSGQGGHGLVVIKYELNTIISPPITDEIFPSFIDGSKLIVYQAPIEYNTELRSLHFSTFQDPLQISPYAGYNWVWYKSFLSLVGLSLTDLLKPSGSVPVNPRTLTGINKVWSYLPDSIYTSLSLALPQVTNFYSTVKDDTKISSIITLINPIFLSFQLIFIQLSSSDPSYTEMTEIYCLLDYLRNSSNLANPHAASGALDRLLGGIPKFGYWANPFFTNASYIGFDVNNGQIPIPELSSIVKSSEPVQAIYGLILEQHLSSGKYEFKDVMAYKPTSLDSISWMMATQSSESYAVRSLTNSIYIESNVPVQPYTFKNAISARLPLFNYSVYTAPTVVENPTPKIYNAPIQILNDFEGSNIYMYSFQNTLKEDISSINISQVPFTSTVLQMNQININQQNAVKPPIIGTIVSEYQSTIVNAITEFGFNGINYKPAIKYTTGTNDYYNTMSPIALDNISNSIVGKAINDLYGNYYFTKNDGSAGLYQSISTNKLYPYKFIKEQLDFASPKYVLGKYNSEGGTPYSDFFVSKYTNIWHLPAKGILDTIYGVRLNSPYDFSIKTNFANQIFYPTHKITLIKTGSLVNPILDTTDTMTYPSFQRTQMFFYKNYSKMISDISGQYAMEKTSNFAYSDMLSGYGFNSYIYNINMPVSTDFNNDNAESFNYLAIRAYSPSETFQSLVRFYLPQRYDFGYISLKDLSNEQLIVTTTPNVNPDYKRFLTIFNGAFSTNQNYGSTGVPGFSGSNISTVSFGDFLNQYNKINSANIKNTAILSTVTGLSNAAITNLIAGDLRNILPSSIANRNRTTDPIEFSIPFSTCATPSNAKIEQYGMGYNLGFAFKDTGYNTVHRATSFFKLLDDSIYLRMNEEFGLNKMDISQPENFAETLETTAQSGRYNSKLILNSFGSFATTFVQSPVTFNPPVGKLDKLSFSWYNSAGVLLNNNDCDWSGSVQIVEIVTASAT
jgi:hypothetical protein